MELHQQQQKKIKGIRQCIIIEEKWLALIDKTENKLESRKKKKITLVQLSLRSPCSHINVQKKKNHV